MTTLKGLTGLIVAVILGLLGGGLNFFYLVNKSQNMKMVSFLGISDDTVVKQGTEFKRSHFVEVPIPANRAQGLEDFVYLYSDLPLLDTRLAIKSYEGGELVFKQDNQTPPMELDLKSNEVLLTISVSNRSPLIQPGDMISFSLPKPNPSNSLEPEYELIGEFEVAAIGNQLGSRSVFEAQGIRPVQSNQIGIIVRTENGQLEPKAQTLQARLSSVGSRDTSVVLHGSSE